MSQLLDRMIRAARLDPKLYEEVEADRSATGQAAAVVAISSLAAGIGGAISGGLLGLAGGTIFALLGWVVWSLTIFFVGTRMLPGARTDADLHQVLRTVGFSAAPGVIRILCFIPVLGMLISFVASCWMLTAMVIAVRHALDYDNTGRAIVVCLVGWVVFLLVSFVLSLAGLGGLFLF